MGYRVDKSEKEENHLDIDRMFTEFIDQHPIENKDTKPTKHKSKKKSNAPNILDLHGDSLSKAVYRVKLKIQQLDQKKVPSPIKIITGKGKHSSGIQPVLKNGIRDFLENNMRSLNIDFREWEGGFDIWERNF